MPRPRRLPPSARRVFLLGVLTLAAYGGYRLFLSKLLPATAVFNMLPQDLAVALGSLACALFLYWLARLRYSGQVLRRLPGAWGAASLVVLGLATAAVCLQWHREVADFDLAGAPLRLAGLAVALSVAACEEIGFRGTLFVSLQDLSGKRGVFWALILGSLGFMLLHGSYQTLWNLPFAAAAGVALGVARLRGASLWSLVFAHALMDGVDPLWSSSSLTLGYWPGLIAAGLALGVALLLWFLPKAQEGRLVLGS
jgi:membrane protease YdiL (CAAX protease family)